MLYYDRINISERIDTNKTSKSRSVIFVTVGMSLMGIMVY